MHIGLDEAVVLIGDQCFEFENNFRYKIDLAREWKEYSGLPFVFACWTANRKLDNEFIKEFNKALQIGVENIDAVVDKFGKSGIIKDKFLKTYLEENIDYNFNEEKKAGLKLFLQLMGKLD